MFQATWTWIWKGNLKKGTGSAVIAAQNKLMTKNRYYATEWGERDKTINHLVSECSKLAQKEFKIWHDRAGKVISWELSKRLNLDYTTKLYMHKPESAQEKEIHKIF